MVAYSNDDHQCLSSLSCELRIIKAKDIELKSKTGSTTGGLFVIYYLSTGNNKKQRIELNSQEMIPSTSSHDDDERKMMIWNESFSLECVGTDEDSIKKNLRQQSVVFELRWRSSLKNLLGKKSKSQLLGRAEVPWKTVLESPNMEIENWVVMAPPSSNNKKIIKSGARVLDEDHVKAAVPSLQVSMKVSVVAHHQLPKKKKSWAVDECGCGGHGACNSCADYELFALMAAMEAL
ncbi:hypothetical protein ACOSP7_021741 [Xanthoceras sorbifolium]